jgi:hypothetical protein
MKRDRWFMGSIIYQPMIDKKRKKCRIPIESFDMNKGRNTIKPPSFHRLSQ